MSRKAVCYLLSLIAYFGSLVGVVVIKSVEPYIFGLPLLLFNAVAWIFLGTGLMLLVHRLNPDAAKEDESA